MQRLLLNRGLNICRPILKPSIFSHVRCISATPSPTPELDPHDDRGTLAKLTDKLLKVGLYGYPDIMFSGSRELAQDYKQNPLDPEERLSLDKIDSMITTETFKSGGVGVLTGILGVIALPIGLPSALMGSWILQTRLSGAIATGAGHNIDDPMTQTKVLLSLISNSTSTLEKIQTQSSADREILSKFNREFGMVRIPLAMVGQVQRMVVAEVAKHATRRGATTVAGRAIPVVGGVVGGVIDASSIQKVGDNAKHIFIKN
jgi:hypothetical protein